MTAQRQGRGGTAVVWFRRDLRLHDLPVLIAALERAERVVPLFMFDDALLGGALAGAEPGLVHARVRPPAARRSAGGGAGARRGGGGRRGLRDARLRPLRARAGRAVAEALERQGVRFHAKRGLMVAEPEEILAGDGRRGRGLRAEI